MIRKDILIRNPSVLDLQNAALLAQVASAFRSKIYIEYGNKKANAKSHMGLLTLNVKPGTAADVSYKS